MNYCSQCGSDGLAWRIPVDDNRERWICESCSTIHYQNPKIVAGALLYSDDRILMARRAIEPRHGYWTLPAGFMELSETTEQAAARECWEEALARPLSLSLYSVFSLPQISQVYLMYQGELLDGNFGVGEESSDANLFTAEEIPWNSIAFPIVDRTLKRFLEDRELGRFPVIEEVIRRKRARN